MTIRNLTTLTASAVTMATTVTISTTTAITVGIAECHDENCVLGSGAGS